MNSAGYQAINDTLTTAFARTAGIAGPLALRLHPDTIAVERHDGGGFLQISASHIVLPFTITGPADGAQPTSPTRQTDASGHLTGGHQRYLANDGEHIRSLCGSHMAHIGNRRTFLKLMHTRFERIVCQVLCSTASCLVFL